MRRSAALLFSACILTAAPGGAAEIASAKSPAESLTASPEGAAEIASAKSPATPPPAATPGPALPPEPPVETPELRAFFDDYMAWGKGELKLEPMRRSRAVPGYRMALVTKKYQKSQEVTDQIQAVLDDAGQFVLAGLLFYDEERGGKAGGADLGAASAMMSKLFGPNLRFKLVLDPKQDLPGWKGVQLLLETGYGGYGGPGWISAGDGAWVMIGQRWERGKPMAEQRKARIKLDATPSEGEPNAKITVVEYSDMECPSCKRRSADWVGVRGRLGNALPIRRYFKSYPLTSIHPWAFRAAAAGRCFFEKDAALFLRWKSAVYSKQDLLNSDSLDAEAFAFAADGGFTPEEFQRCYFAPKTVQRILEDLSEGFVVGVRSTPTFVVDGVIVAWYDDNDMEEYLRTVYLKGAGLPLKKTAVKKAPAKVVATKAPAKKK